MNDDSAGVYVNERRVPFQPGGHLADLLEGLDIEPQTVATALNGAFVARERRVETPLQAGDHVAVFVAIVGG